MKLARLVLLLVVANLGFFAWSQGWLDGLGVMAGLRSQPEREPERMARQFQPHLLRVVPPGAVAAATAASGGARAASAADAAACLEAGPFSTADASAAEALLQPTLAPGSWTRRSIDKPGVWIVYLGRYIAADALQRQVAELRRLQLPFDDVASPTDLAPGLSLGRFDSRQAADEALATLTQRGVRAARVVLLTEPETRIMLRVEPADAAIAARLRALPGSVAGQPLAATFKPCPD